jgi:hypothetical protein
MPLKVFEKLLNLLKATLMISNLWFNKCCWKKPLKNAIVNYQTLKTAIINRLAFHLLKVKNAN